MNPHTYSPQSLTIRDYARVLWRRRWTILAAALVGLLAGVAVTLKEGAAYTASAQVLVGIGEPPQGAYQRVAPDRLNQTQAELAETPRVAQRALAAAGVSDVALEDFLAESKVTANPETDILMFTVTDRRAARASALATQYAREFIAARRTIDKGDYVRQVGEAFLLAPADAAAQTEPEATRNLILGLALGLILGIVLAFIREAVDPRLRSSAAILERVGLPLLGRFPKASGLRLTQRRRAGARTDRLTMLDEPDGRDAEPYRMLRTNVDLFNIEHGARTIMVTSAERREGKSTTVANLAIALAHSGRRVVLVDLDLRRPELDRLFEIEGRAGAADEVFGRVTLEDALVPIEIDPAHGLRQAGAVPVGRLEVLPAGPMPSNHGEYFASEQLRALLGRLKERADLVLVDGPPLVDTGDGIVAAAEVDAIAVVAAVDEAREPVLSELRRVLHTCRAVKLGVILTEVPREDTYATSPIGDAPFQASTQVSRPNGSNGSVPHLHGSESAR
jgi:capsular exopolysaccharide synthesis family protein